MTGFLKIHILYLITFEDSWVKELFTPDELKQYAQFEHEVQASGQKALFKKEWQQLAQEVRDNLSNDPYSQIGIDLGGKYMDWVNRIYGKKYAHLRTKKFEQGFGEGKGLAENGLNAEMLAWIEKATDAYWHDRLYTVLNTIGSIPPATALTQWNALLDEMYGNEEARKVLIYEMALHDDKVRTYEKPAALGQ